MIIMVNEVVKLKKERLSRVSLSQSKKKISQKLENKSSSPQNDDSQNLSIVTLLSSGDELEPKKIKKKNKGQLKKTNLKQIETPKNIEETKEKPSTKRKLTRNTNLKTFSAKDQPEDQTKIEQFFTLTPNPNGIKYFDTFLKSKKPENDKINNNIDCLELIMNDVKNLKSFESPLIKNNLINSSQNIPESVSQHFQLKKRTICSLDNITTVEKSSISHKIQNKLLNKLIATESHNSFGVNTTMTTNNIYNSDNESRFNSSESFAFYYNSVPSVKTESVIYSLDENTTSHSAIFTNNAEEVVATELPNKKAKKRLSFQTSTLKNSINSVPDIGQYKYNSYNNPIIIEDDDSAHITPDKSQKISKTTSKLKSCLKKSNVKNSTSNKKTTLQTVIKKRPNNRRNRVLQCPSYKIIEGTTFAVDGFRFGEIEGVTHYFLTHFHGDHYIGLRKNFSMPIFLTTITATLVTNFIHVSPEFLNIINTNETKIINGIEVTAIDANHCPGAVMFAFKLANGKCILHTGDFRASSDMESESYFWNNDIDTIYLDTTYLHKSYDFKQQSESIADVRYCIEDFCEKHIGQRILFVCGSYVIGKEKVWAEIAKITKNQVYTNGNRRKALKAIGDPDLIKHLNDNPKEANIHVLTMNELNYLKLYDYFQLYNEYFDVLLAIRPSGWEKNSKPKFSGLINVVGIEYSEHSSYSELRRFCRYLQPKKIISTVPINNCDMTTTAKIPESWFNSSAQPRQQGYQPTIRSYISETLKNHSDEDQQACCSKYLKENDYGSVYATMGISPDKKEKLLEVKDNKSKLSDDWMS